MAVLTEEKILIEKINQLQSGNYDTPISADEKSKVIDALEQLRTTLRSARHDLHEERKEVDHTISSVAHDLKTPIAIILGYAESIEAGMTDKDYISLIINKAEEMNRQVLQIVEAGKKEKQTEFFEKIEARDFLKTEFEKYRQIIEGKNIIYKVAKAPDIEFFADKTAISCIVQNLLSNAIKYTPAGGKIKVWFSKAHHNFVINVKDSGKGIAKADLPNVFDKFYMADKTRNDNKNSGLGLYIVKKEVDRHGGRVDVKSKEGKGAKFQVSIPLEKSAKGFDNLPRIAKFFIFLFLYPFNPSFIYRIRDAVNTFDNKHILSTCLSFPFMYLVWFYDIVTILVENKIR